MKNFILKQIEKFRLRREENLARERKVQEILKEDRRHVTRHWS